MTGNHVDPTATGRNAHPTGRLTARDFIFTLLCGLTVYCAFCLAPGSQVWLGGSPRPTGELLGSAPLHRAAEFLRESAPGARLYAPAAWSDFLVGRAGNGVTAMLTSGGPRVLQSAHGDDRRLEAGKDGWERAADRHGIDTLVLDVKGHPALTEAARRSPAWTVVYETDGVFIARLRNLTAPW